MSRPATPAAGPRAGGATMQAGVLIAARHAELCAQPRPEPGPGQVRVRLEGSGVCGSDLPVWQGREWFVYPREPGAPGHEGWGVVDALGPGTATLAVGDRVTGLMYHAYAEYDVLSEREAVVIPPALDGVPVPGEPLGCAVNVLRRSAIGPGDTVAVVGIGFLGALITQLAAGAGARVIAVGRRPFARALAEELGADATLPADAGVAEAVGELTGGRMCDVVVEAAGAQASLDLASGLVRTRGRLVIAGFHQDGPRQVDLQSWNWRGIDVINAHERDPAVYVEGMRIAVDLQARGRLTPERLYTHSLPLGRLDAALGLLEQRPDGFLKALVRA